MSAILGLSNIFALIYMFRGLQLSATIWRERKQIQTPPLTRRKKHLAEQASFFIAVPIGVFIHEFGHALATWLFGGQVIEFGYRVFWGYVIPQGAFSPIQYWFISLAGTLGSLIFGVSIWLLFRSHSNTSLRYFGLRAFRFQVYFSLLYYPVFTLLGFIGDWRTIYDFGSTPLASSLTIPLHVGMVFLFWWGSRVGWFEMASHESVVEEDEFEALARETAVSPHDTRLQLQYIDALRRGGAVNKAKTQLKSFLEQNPDSSAGYLQLAALQSANKSQVPRQAIRNAEKALSLGLPSQGGTTYAHQLLGKYYLDSGDGEKATQHLSQAIAYASNETADVRYLVQLYHWRSQAYRRQHHYDLAFQDVEHAISLAQSVGDGELADFYRSELEIIEKHAGRTMGIPFSPTDMRQQEEVMPKE